MALTATSQENKNQTKFLLVLPREARLYPFFWFTGGGQGHHTSLNLNTAHYIPKTKGSSQERATCPSATWKASQVQFLTPARAGAIR